MAKDYKSAYAEKLKDPRWQRKRLEIMQRDDFTCKKCGDNESMLVVHHRYYIGGREPWEYDSGILVTLCQNCHEDEHAYEGPAEDFQKILKAKGFFNSDIVDILTTFHCMTLDYPPQVFTAALNRALFPVDGMEKFMNEYFQAIKKAPEKVINGQTPEAGT